MPALSVSSFDCTEANSLHPIHAKCMWNLDRTLARTRCIFAPVWPCLCRSFLRATPIAARISTEFWTVGPCHGHSICATLTAMTSLISACKRGFRKQIYFAISMRFRLTAQKAGFTEDTIIAEERVRL
jgi:hypothetical protein